MNFDDTRIATVNLSSFVGKYVVGVRGMEKGSEEIYILFDDTSALKFHHDQDCCGNVSVEDVIGDPTDLVCLPLLMCEEVESVQPDYYSATSTWYKFASIGGYTWYKFASIGGYVTVRWLGTSNGYYSEGVDVSSGSFAISDLTPEEAVRMDECLSKH
jgi:hypothetical protein